MITALKPEEVFVFGSNLAGSHVGGAALQAKTQFGAKDGVGEGLTGQCYAFPTLGRRLEKRGRKSLETSRQKFFNIVRANPEKTFLLTKVGCGIAGYEEYSMKALFRGAPKNVVFPDDWKN